MSWYNLPYTDGAWVWYYLFVYLFSVPVQKGERMMRREELLQKIHALLDGCHDLALLDFILQLLQKLL